MLPSIRSQALELLIEQYKQSPRLKSLINALLEQADHLERVFQQIRDAMHIDKAKGWSLDVLGRIVVLERPWTELDPDLIFTFNGPEGGGFHEGYFISLFAHSNARIDDETYRMLIRSKILLNTTSCTIDDMLRSLSLILGEDAYLRNHVGWVELVLESAPTLYMERLINATFPLTAGVRLVKTVGPQWTTPAPTTPGPSTTPGPTTPGPSTTPGPTTTGGPTTAPPSTQAPLEYITQVGSTVYHTVSTGYGTENKALPTGLQEGDLVFVITAADYYNPECGLGGNTQGYTVFYNQRDLPDYHFGYKIMGYPPDSYVTLRQYAVCKQTCIIQAWRGVDKDHILDVLTPAFTKGYGKNIQPPTITPLTQGSRMIAMGFLDNKDAHVLTFPVGWEACQYRNTGQGFNDYGVMAAVASKVWMNGAQTPSPFVVDWADNWEGQILALRPAGVDSSGITQVGGVINGVVELGFGTQDIELPAGLQEGDVVLVMDAFDNAVEGDGLEANTQGYTVTTLDQASPGCHYGYKVMGSTPDTHVTLGQHGGYKGAYIITAWRGVDPNQVLDVPTPTKTTGVSSTISPPSIAPVTDGALVIVMAFLDDDDTTVAQFPPQYGAAYQSNTYQGLSDHAATLAMAGKLVKAGEENPGNFVMNASDAWIGATIALRPIVPTTTPP